MEIILQREVEWVLKSSKPSLSPLRQRNVPKKIDRNGISKQTYLKHCFISPINNVKTLEQDLLVSFFSLLPMWVKFSSHLIFCILYHRVKCHLFVHNQSSGTSLYRHPISYSSQKFTFRSKLTANKDPGVLRILVYKAQCFQLMCLHLPFNCSLTPSSMLTENN